MSLTYIQYPSYKNDIKKVYLNSFPKEERFPFGILEECAKEKKSYLYAILDNETFVGMYFIVNCDNAYYLMYFSVIDTLRNKKYGSKILQDLKEKYGTLFLSIEQPVDELSIRRKNFYLKNGFFETNKIYTDTEVCYEILCTNSNYIITNDTMLKRYKNMSSNPKVLDTISNTFNTNSINLTNKLNKL